MVLLQVVSVRKKIKTSILSSQCFFHGWKLTSFILSHVQEDATKAMMIKLNAKYVH